jgi:hypothetical protein
MYKARDMQSHGMDDRTKRYFNERTKGEKEKEATPTQAIKKIQHTASDARDADGGLGAACPAFGACSASWHGGGD